jgi:hypothetical protein
VESTEREILEKSGMKSENERVDYVRSFKLTRYIVPHSSFDWYTRVMGLSTLAILMVVGAGGWVYLQQLFEATGLQAYQEAPGVVEQYKRMTLIGTCMIVLTATLYVTLVAGFLFHRVAGPVFSLKRHMVEIMDGKPVQEIVFRDTDQLGDLAETYNQLLHHLELVDPKPESEERVNG